MTASKCEVSRCGLCRFYTHEGRRGGTCEQLSVPVSSQWKACCLAVSPFHSAASVATNAVMGIDKSLLLEEAANPAEVSEAEVSVPATPSKRLANPKIVLTTKVPAKEIIGS